MLDLYLLAAQPAHELHIVVPRDAERRTRSHHIANNADGIENMRSTIDQIAEEDRAPSRRVPPALVTPRGVRIRQSEPLPPCLFEQHPQFIGTAMQVAEDIERTRLVLLVVPQRRALDLNLLRSIEDVDVSKPLPFQSSETAFDIADLPPDHVRPEVAVRAAAVAFLAHPLWRIHHDGDRKAVVLASMFDQALSIFRTNIGRIDNGQPSAREPLLDHVVQRVECIVRARLIVLIVTDQPAEEVR